MYTLLVKSLCITLYSLVFFTGGYDVEIDLQTGNILGEDRSINLMYNDGVASQSCNIQAVFNVTFDSHENASNPNLHRRLLVDLWFTNPENWVFHIGDSQSNDGNSK